MTPPNELLLVLTGIVLNRKHTGYRGVYRTPPISLAFEDPKGASLQALLDGLNEDGDVWFTDAEKAVAWARLSRDHGYQVEVIRCIAADKPRNAAVAEQFLGWDVAQFGGGFYSAIVDRCLHLWEQPHSSGQAAYATLMCVAEYFNAKLNACRLFPDYETAALFLQVHAECAARFGGETNVRDLQPIGVSLLEHL